MKSLMSSAGSPKKASAPCSSSTSSRRWIAPTEMAATLPYLVISDLPRWPMSLAMARRSLRSSSGMSSSAATRNRMLSTPSCVSLSSSRRESSSGPMSCTVARTGWPCSPNTSQNTVGKAVLDQSSRPISLARLASPSFLTPGLGDAGQVALDVGGEHRHARSREAFGQHLQRHRLAGAGGARDQAVAVGELELQVLRLDAAAEEDLALLHQAFRFEPLARSLHPRNPTPLCLNYMRTSGWQSRGARLPREKTRQFCYRGSMLADPTSPGTGAFTMRSDVPLRPMTGASRSTAAPARRFANGQPTVQTRK